jgi:BON domain
MFYKSVDISFRSARPNGYTRGAIMRRWKSRITVLGLACAGLLLAGVPAFAQTSSSSGSFGGSGGSSGIGSSGPGGSSFGGGSSSSFGVSSGSSFGGGSGGSGFAGGSSSGNSAFGGASGITPGGQSSTSSVPGRGASAAIGATSFLGAYYVNPLAQGIGTGSTTQTKFGSPLFTLATTGQTGTASIRATNPASGYFGAPIGVRRLPAYATTLKIKDMPAPETPLQVREDLRNMLAKSGQLDSKDAFRVLMDGPAVVLQGEVVDDDERRLVENMVRLTPGVNAIRNELAARNPAP